MEEGLKWRKDNNEGKMKSPYVSGSHTDGNECKIWSTEYGMKDVRKGKKEGGRGDESREEETDSEYKLG